MLVNIVRETAWGYFIQVEFLYPEGVSENATLIVVLVVGISSPGSKNPQGFLSMQRSAAKLCVHIPADIAHRLTASDFSLFSN